MSWAKLAIDRLSKGETVRVKPRGNSMSGKINDGDLVTLEPCDTTKLSIGDVVLVRVRGNVVLHLIKSANQGRFLIGNNRGGINGWVGANAVYGKAIKVESR